MYREIVSQQSEQCVFCAWLRLRTFLFQEVKWNEKWWNNPKWLPMIAKLAQLMTFAAARDLGYSTDAIKDIAKTYAIKEIARKIELGETPTSKTQLLKQLQTVVTAMFGEGTEDKKYKVTSWDVAFIEKLFCKKSRKALSMIASSTNEMEILMLQVCNRIILDKHYEIEYKKAKNS